MGIYRYTRLGTEIPPIPIVPLELLKPGRIEGESIVGQAILDTGSDCTLVPIPWLIQVKAQIADRPLRIPVGGQVSLAIPYEVGINFDRYRHFVFRVYGCSVDEIGEMALVGRDLMNLYRPSVVLHWSDRKLPLNDRTSSLGNLKQISIYECDRGW